MTLTNTAYRQYEKLLRSGSERLAGDPYLPVGAAEHLVTLKRKAIAQVQPHSISLARESLEQMAYDAESGLWLGKGKADESPIILPPPLVVFLDGAYSTIDGDHRFYTATRQQPGELPVLLYDLHDQEDIGLLIERDENITKEAILRNENEKFLYLLTPTAPETFISTIEGSRKFVATKSIRKHDDLANRIKERREETEIEHDAVFRDYLR